MNLKNYIIFVLILILCYTFYIKNTDNIKKQDYLENSFITTKYTTGGTVKIIRD